MLLRFVFLREGDDREHKVETQVDNVLVVQGMGFNLFSGWRISVNGHAVSFHADGTHIMNGKLIFMRGPTSDYSYAIRQPPPQTDTIVQHEICECFSCFPRDCCRADFRPVFVCGDLPRHDFGP